MRSCYQIKIWPFLNEIWHEIWPFLRYIFNKSKKWGLPYSGQYWKINNTLPYGPPLLITPLSRYRSKNMSTIFQLLFGNVIFVYLAYCACTALLQFRYVVKYSIFYNSFCNLIINSYVYKLSAIVKNWVPKILINFNRKYATNRYFQGDLNENFRN